MFILIPGQMRQSYEPLPAEERTSPAIAAGSMAYLSNHGRSMGIAADAETFIALANAVAAKDRLAYEHLFRDGRAFLVDDRVQVLVIRVQSDSVEVRFLEGYHSGKSGFAVRDWLKSRD